MKRVLCILFAAGFSVACSSAGPTVFDKGASDDAGTPPASGDAGTALACNGYPQGPYGTTVGTTIQPGYAWQGYAPKAASSSTISSQDLSDCDGSKGINAIVLDVSAVWCAACQSQAADMKQLFAEYDQLGVRVVTMIVQDASSAPATVQTAEQWRQQYGLDDITVVADPSFSLQPSSSGSINLPMTVLVDPRTMKIVGTRQGYMSAYPITPPADVVALAKKNGAQ